MGGKFAREHISQAHQEVEAKPAKSAPGTPEKPERPAKEQEPETKPGSIVLPLEKIYGGPTVLRDVGNGFY